jgi:hypothetical protein
VSEDSNMNTRRAFESLSLHASVVRMLLEQVRRVSMVSGWQTRGDERSTVCGWCTLLFLLQLAGFGCMS